MTEQNKQKDKLMIVVNDAGTDDSSSPVEASTELKNTKTDPSQIRERIFAWLHTTESVLIQIFIVIMLVIKLSQVVMNSI